MKRAGVAPQWFTPNFHLQRRPSSAGLYEHTGGEKYFIKTASVHRANILDEVQILQKLSSRFVQPLRWLWMEGTCLYMVFDWIDISLQDLLDQRSKLSVVESRQMFQNLLLAIDYLQESDVVHRCIKPSSVLLTSNGHVKLGNFRVALSLEGQDYIIAPLAGCYLTMPPEAGANIASTAWDVWSAVVVLYRMLTGVYPFTPVEVCYTVREAVNLLFIQIKERSFRLDILGSECSEASFLVKSVFTPGWRDRPCAKDLLRSEFMYIGTSSLLERVLNALLPNRLERPKKIIRPPPCFACVIHKLKDAVKTNTAGQEKASPSSGSVYSPHTPCGNQHPKGALWVVHWADYSHVFGFCVTFSNGCVSILFNDSTTVSCDPDEVTHYFEKDGAGWRFPLRCAPQSLKAKVAYLQWWRKETGRKSPNTPETTTGIRGWWRTESGMALSFDGVLQFDFIDGVRLVISVSHILKFPKFGACELVQWTPSLISPTLWERLAHLELVFDKIYQCFPRELR